MISLIARWDEPTQRLLRRMGRLDKLWPPAIAGRLRTIATTAILPAARGILRRRYHFSGRAAQSLGVLDAGHSRGAAWVEMGTTLAANDPPVFGEWAASPFIYPLGLHEGIKAHRVWIRRPGWSPPERRGLAEWAHARRIPDPGGQWWSIRVYRRGRAGSRWPFLHMATMQRRIDIEDAIMMSLDRAIRGAAAAPPWSALGRGLAG